MSEYQGEAISENEWFHAESEYDSYDEPVCGNCDHFDGEECRHGGWEGSIRYSEDPACEAFRLPDEGWQHAKE